MVASAFNLTGNLCRAKSKTDGNLILPFFILSISAALSQLAERLGRAFNVETIILPLDINISDAIMSFQESGFQITQKVFDACGKPDYLTSRSRREAEASASADRSGSGRAISLDDGDRQRLQGVGHAETRKEVEVSTQQPIQSKGKSDFERMMEDLRRVVRIHFRFDFLLLLLTIFTTSGPQFPGVLATHAVPNVPQH